MRKKRKRSEIRAVRINAFTKQQGEKLDTNMTPFFLKKGKDKGKEKKRKKVTSYLSKCILTHSVPLVSFSVSARTPFPVEKYYYRIT